MADEKVLTLRLAPDLHERVQSAARRQRRSIHNLISVTLEESFADQVPDGRKSSSVRLGDWTIWWYYEDPNHIKITGNGTPDEMELFQNPFSGTPGNGRAGSKGLWVTLHRDDPADKNNWNRCVHAFEATGQAAPPYWE